MCKSRGADQTSRRVSGPLALDGGEPYCRAPSMRSSLLTPASSPGHDKMILVPFSEQTVENHHPSYNQPVSPVPDPCSTWTPRPAAKPSPPEVCLLIGT